MARKITNFFREFVLAFSIILTILGIIVIFIGATAIWFKDIPEDLLNLSKDFLFWKEYLLIIGFIIFAAGIWYLYSYLKNRKFVLDELKTNRRSEFLKRHNELKDIVKLLPSKYKKLLADKENELRIK